MSKNTKPESKSEAKEAKPVAAPSFKAFVRLCNSEDRPRGIKGTINADGGVTFSYGSKAAPIAVIASKDELVALGVSALGVKLS